jgi:hypothetical protein
MAAQINLLAIEDRPASELITEAKTVVDLAAARGVVVRALGGLAVRILCPSLPPRTRDGQDLDLATTGASRRQLRELLEEHGYVGDRHFNALHGNKQLYFAQPETGVVLDVLIDKLEMCHTVDFSGRLERMPYTLDPLDLLLTKLQIVELNEKDVDDCLQLLVTFAAADSDEPGMLDLGRFRAIVGDDWGWWRTATQSLGRIRASLAAGPRAAIAGGELDPLVQLDAFDRAAEEAPKSRRWKLRARVGDRVRWYELPQEEAH